MNTMRALLRKDVPWLLFFLLGGTAGMVAALCSGSFVYTFVVSSGRREELFHVAWSCGLGLGVAAACFDEVLGVRDFLACRPVPAAAVLRARLLGCAVVLAGWFVLVPFVAYLVMALGDSAWQAGWFRQLPSLWGAMVPAVSMCAVGLCAGGLPFPWWVRLLALAPMAVLPFTIIFSCERPSPSAVTSWPVFVGGHATLAVGAVAWAWLGCGLGRDADQPVGMCVRRRAVAPLLGVAAVVAALVLQLLASTAVARLHASWPDVVVHDGKPLLAVRPDWDEPWVVVDAEHRPTGERLPQVQRLGHGAVRLADIDLRIEAPREKLGLSSGGSAGSLLVDADSTVFWWPRGAGPRRLESTADMPRFGPKAWVESLDRSGERTVVAGEPGDQALWLFDPASEGFVRLPLPDGDRVAHRWLRPRTASEPLPDAAVVPAKDEDLVYGERFGYALRDRRLVKVSRLVPASPDPMGESNRLRFVDVDCLAGTVEYDTGAGIAPFRHRFEPRTWFERCFAGLALLLSSLRPPVLQLASAAASFPAIDSHASPDAPPLPRSLLVLLDPLVLIGGRWWLAGASIAVAILMTWTTRRRLRDLGADAGTHRFWTIAVLLLGPVAAWLAISCERPRAWADRTVRIPVPAPRIVSPAASPEVVA